MKVWRCEVTREQGVEFLVWAETREEASAAATELAEGLSSSDWESGDDDMDCWPRAVPLDAALAAEIKVYGIWVGGPGGKFQSQARVPEPEPPDPRQPGPGQETLAFDGPPVVQDTQPL